ncbi:hypothetical protein Cgig2_018636 [Carnegiea gigantea]|uniref:Reverse transcriptase zinc-binding domain-containing protein n=1 Tax=Carnegiea gigantea TaxID=171969 RepID=A0A9Q1QJE0_9CARY|nr:hypothetical protein Cgig2_018636 [Carnegiea gigantea]
MSTSRSADSRGLRILVRNTQGAGSPDFIHMIKEHVRMQRPHIIALLETHVSGSRADDVCNKIGFRGKYRVEVRGYQGGIWILWLEDVIQVCILEAHEQFVTAWMLHRGFEEFIRQCWKLNSPVTEALGNLAEKLSVWSKEIYEYWQPRSGCQWEDFEAVLPWDILDRIRAIQVYPDAGIQDELFWGKTSSGLLSMQSAKNVLRGESPSIDHGRRKDIWNLKAPQKTKTFPWIVLHPAVLTNENRVKRGFATNPNCNLCQGTIKDIDHILRSCKVACDIWSYFKQARQGIHDPTLDFEDWIL